MQAEEELPGAVRGSLRVGRTERLQGETRLQVVPQPGGKIAHLVDRVCSLPPEPVQNLLAPVSGFSQFTQNRGKFCRVLVEKGGFHHGSI